MKVYLFGNPDLPEDNLAFQIGERLKGIPELQFVNISPNEDLPFAGEPQAILVDVVENLDKITLWTEKDLDKLILSPRTSVHDFDLGFQLRYLQKIGQLNKVTIIGLPQKGEIDYDFIQSIFKKLVAQDIQGS